MRKFIDLCYIIKSIINSLYHLWITQTSKSEKAIKEKAKPQETARTLLINKQTKLDIL